MTPYGENRFRGAVSLALFALIAVILLSALDWAARDRSEANRKARLDRQLNDVLLELERDNDSASDVILIRDKRLGSQSPLPVYRARKGDVSTGVVITSVAPDGYSGQIRLLIGVDIQGTVLGTRVLEHRETPGIGDRIEHRRSDWITLIKNRSLKEPALERWHTRAPDGAFDAITGATITSDAVLSAVRNALLWLEDNRHIVFTSESSSKAFLKTIKSVKRTDTIIQ